MPRPIGKAAVTAFRRLGSEGARRQARNRCARNRCEQHTDYPVQAASGEHQDSRAALEQIGTTGGNSLLESPRAPTRGVGQRAFVALKRPKKSCAARSNLFASRTGQEGPGPAHVLVIVDDEDGCGRGRIRLALECRFHNVPLRNCNHVAKSEQRRALVEVSSSGPFESSHSGGENRPSSSAPLDAQGSVNRNALPSPSVESTQIWPPCRSTTRRTIANPIPSPGATCVCTR